MTNFTSIQGPENIKLCNLLSHSTAGVETLPDDKVMRVNLWAAAAVQQDSRIPHDGTPMVVLVLHGGQIGRAHV